MVKQPSRKFKNGVRTLLTMLFDSFFVVWRSNFGLLNVEVQPKCSDGSGFFFCLAPSYKNLITRLRAVKNIGQRCDYFCKRWKDSFGRMAGVLVCLCGISVLMLA